MPRKVRCLGVGWSSIHGWGGALLRDINSLIFCFSYISEACCLLQTFYLLISSATPRTSYIFVSLWLCKKYLFPLLTIPLPIHIFLFSHFTQNTVTNAWRWITASFLAMPLTLQLVICLRGFHGPGCIYPPEHGPSVMVHHFTPVSNGNEANDP